MKKIASLLALLLAGIALGYLAGLFHATRTIIPALDFFGHSHLFKFMDSAQAAYQKESPEIAVWALEQLADRLNEQLEQEYESRWFPREVVKMDLMLAYARLAKLLETQDPQCSQEYVQKALQIGSKRCEDEIISEQKLFEFLARVDSNIGTEQSEPGAAVDQVPPGKPASRR